MNEEQAEHALAIIREVIQHTRDDLVEHNWGVIWMCHAFTNLGAFLYIGHRVEVAGGGVFDYLAPLASVAVINFCIIFALRNRKRGIRSVIEWQIHGIWGAFMIFSLLGAAVLALADASLRLLCPMMAMTSGFGFAMMGILFERRYLLVAFGLLLSGLHSAWNPQWQWDYFGALWFVALFTSGFKMHAELRSRRADGQGTEVL